MNVKNKTVLITGASSGIGKEFATQLAGKGASLIITARSEDALNKLASQLEQEYTGIWVKVIPLDLLESNSPQTLFSTIKTMNISVDYLINNAGFGQFCEFTNEKFSRYQQMITLNINALVELSHLFLPEMKKNNAGGIINVASTGSFQPLPYQAVYGASKAFVLSFSEALSGELLESNVHVMALCPGMTESNFMDNANADTSSMKLSSAHDVVKTGLDAFGKKRIFIVAGLMNYLTSLVPRLVSRQRTVSIVVNMLKNTVKTTNK